MKIKDLIIIVLRENECILDYFFFSFLLLRDIFRFLLTRRKANAEILKICGDKSPSTKCPLESWLRRNVRNNIFTFLCPTTQTLQVGQPVGCAEVDSLLQGEGKQRVLIFVLVVSCGAAVHGESSTGEEGPGAGAVTAPAGTAPQRKKEAVTANSRSTHLHQSNIFFPHPCSVSIEQIWFAVSLERSHLRSNCNGFFFGLFCRV